MTAAAAHYRTGPVDALIRRGSPPASCCSSRTRQPGDTILRPTGPADDLTADLLRFGAGLVTLILAIVLGLGT